jgi:hypothetical protein
VLGAASRTTRVGVHQWTHDGPDGFHMQSITGVSRLDPIPSAAVGPNGLFVNAHNVGSTTIPLSKIGTYRTRAWVRAGVDDHGVFVGYELYIDHVVEVTPHRARDSRGRATAAQRRRQLRQVPRHEQGAGAIRDEVCPQQELGGAVGEQDARAGGESADGAARIDQSGCTTPRSPAAASRSTSSTSPAA